MSPDPVGILHDLLDDVRPSISAADIYELSLVAHDQDALLRKMAGLRPHWSVEQWSEEFDKCRPFP